MEVLGLSILRKLEAYYANLYAKVEEELGRVEHDRKKIEGRLDIGNTSRSPRYYLTKIHPVSKKREREYLDDSKMSIAKTLAQYSYLKKLFRVISRRLKKIQGINAELSRTSIDDLYNNLIPARKDLVKPIMPTQEQDLEAWLNANYTGLAVDSDDHFYVTNRGERVRSKTEKILADLFDFLDIPYKYECPLFLDHNQVLYPDFTFYDRERREEIYWEHFGLMSDPLYVKRTLEKIRIYEAHGIHPGDRLLISYESQEIPFDIELAREMAKKHLL